MGKDTIEMPTDIAIKIYGQLTYYYFFLKAVAEKNGDDIVDKDLVRESVIEVADLLEKAGWSVVKAEGL
jgi:hypothetical protein